MVDTGFSSSHIACRNATGAKSKSTPRRFPQYPQMFDTAPTATGSTFGATDSPSSKYLRLARFGALASLPIVAFSLVFHVLTGHRPDTPQGMAVPEFVLEHPSFVVVVVLAALVLWWLPRASA
jgi:hypothetical protein